jgi:hypothetical protein
MDDFNFGSRERTPFLFLIRGYFVLLYLFIPYND